MPDSAPSDAALAQNHELRRLLELVPSQLFILRADLTVEWANQAILDYHGPALSAVLFATDLPQRDRTLQHPDDVARVTAEGTGPVLAGSAFEVEARLRSADGAYRWFLIRLNPVRDAAGRVACWIGSRTDVDAHKRSEERVRQDERELRTVVDTVPEHVVVLDPEGRIRYANRAALTFTGLGLDALLAHPDVWPDIIHPDDLPLLRRTIEDMARGIPSDVELRLRRADGEYRWVHSRNTPLRDDAGQVLRWFATGFDIDERKRAELRMRDENLALREEVAKASMFEEIVGASPALRAVLTGIAKVAPTDSTVLVTGETGTGKELVARAIHERSPRAGRPFVSVNCAAIPTSLIASELFGHEKGAFTGALQRRAGRFELADGGTLFLDEIGELPADTQVALLRALQEREVERVGSARAIRVDVRVIAATNRDLQAAMAGGTFRSDLFYRLNVFPIEMPALRDRASDIPLLVSYFVERYARQAGKTIRDVDPRSLDVLQAYRWPGNVRELQNVVERAVIVCDADTLVVDPLWLSAQELATADAIRPLADELAARERQMIEAALVECGGRVAGAAGAAAKLGVPASTLESRIRALGIAKRRFR